jgi:hypothetical protein
MKEWERRPQQINQEAQENVTHQPPEIAGLTPVEKAREELIIFAAGAERTSPRFKAFSNWVSDYEVLLYGNEPPREDESAWDYYGRRLRDKRTEGQKRDQRVKANKALVKGYAKEYRRARRKVDNYTGKLEEEFPLTHLISESVEQGRTIARALIAVREEVIARQQQQSQTPPQE